MMSDLPQTPEERQEYENRLAAAFGRKPRNFLREASAIGNTVADGFQDKRASLPVGPENFIAPTSKPTRAKKRD